MLNVLGEDTYARERDVYHKLTELKITFVTKLLTSN